MKNNFDYIIYLAFITSLMYENKRTLSIKELHDYRITLCKNSEAYYSQFDEFDDKGFEESLNCFFSLHKNMTNDEEESNLLNFLKNNSKFFVYNNGIISLKDEVNYEQLTEYIFDLDSNFDLYERLITGNLYSFSDCIECLYVLGLHKIKDFVYKILEDEKNIEKMYSESNLDKLEEDIKDLVSSVNYKMALIGNLNDDKMRCYHRAIVGSGKIDLNNKVEDYSLLSAELDENDEFLDLNRSYIEHMFTQPFLNAIFDTNSLAYSKLDNILNAMWCYREPEDAVLEVEPVDSEAYCTLMAERMEQAEMYEDEFDDEIEEDYDDSEYNDDDNMTPVECHLYDKKVKMAFYLNYINNINKYQNEYRDEGNLDIVKRRLLYILDSYGENLYNEENFNKMFNDISISYIDYKEDFYDFYLMSRLFLIDYLKWNYEDERTLRKILIASTYYNLTKDERIKKIINKYKNTKQGTKISDAILYGDFSKLKFDNDALTKRLNKKNK